VLQPTPIRDPAPARRFLVDAMLGRLGRWLRVLGFDAAYHPSLSDRELVLLAARESRILLTRDRHLVEHLRPTDALLLRSQVPLEQLREVVDGRSLRAPDSLFTRCLVCNTELEAVEPEDAARLLPERARDLPGPVRRCPTCLRVYWPGSHARRMREALSRALPEWFP
jgi:uncharacterized protein